MDYLAKKKEIDKVKAEKTKLKQESKVEEMELKEEEEPEADGLKYRVESTTGQIVEATFEAYVSSKLQIMLGLETNY